MDLQKVYYICDQNFPDDVVPAWEFYEKNLILRIMVPDSVDNIIAEYYIPLKQLKEELEKV